MAHMARDPHPCDLHPCGSSSIWIFIHGASDLAKRTSSKRPTKHSGFNLEMLAHLDFTASPTHEEIIAQLARVASRLLLDRAEQTIKAREK